MCFASDFIVVLKVCDKLYSTYLVDTLEHVDFMNNCFHRNVIYIYKPSRDTGHSDISRGDRVEYFHRDSASRRRRRKGNSVPGVITGPPCSLGL
jgi:hypothetical protein